MTGCLVVSVHSYTHRNESRVAFVRWLLELHRFGFAVCRKTHSRTHLQSKLVLQQHPKLCTNEQAWCEVSLLDIQIPNTVMVPPEEDATPPAAPALGQHTDGTGYHQQKHHQQQQSTEQCTSSDAPAAQEPAPVTSLAAALALRKSRAAQQMNNYLSQLSAVQVCRAAALCSSLLLHIINLGTMSHAELTRCCSISTSTHLAVNPADDLFVSSSCNCRKTWHARASWQPKPQRDTRRCRKQQRRRMQQQARQQLWQRHRQQCSRLHSLLPLVAGPVPAGLAWSRS